jgi:hypothetical protein
VNHVLADMRARLARGQEARAELYLAAPSAPANLAVVRAVVEGERALRREAGEDPPPDEYVTRFPVLRDSFGGRPADALPGAETVSGRPAGGSGSPARTLVRTPDHIGRYRILAQLGAGGQAVVYRAFHPGLEREVVIKLGLYAAGDQDLIRAEGRTLADLDHPGLARVYDFDVHNGYPYLVMELVPGRNLDRAAREEPPGPRRAAGLVAQVARAAAAAHRHGVVHRDIKPANILLGADDRPRLIDFGLARVRPGWADAGDEPASLSGTLSYMPPEQARGEDVRIGPRTDVFALGGVLYYLLTGNAPFVASTAAGCLARAQAGDWDRARLAAVCVPRRLKDVCARAMAPDPADRYPTADDLAADLEAAACPFPTRRVTLFAGAATVIAAAALIAWAAGWLGSSDRPQPVPPPGGPVAAPPEIRLDVRVWRGDRPRYLADVGGVEAGDELRAEVKVPPGRTWALFWVGSDGRVERLIAGLDGEVLSFPSGPSQFFKLTGPPGTEAVLLCGAAGEVDIAAVREALGPGPLAVLPPESVLRVGPDRVTVEVRARGVGEVLDRPNPEGEVVRRLEATRAKLRERYEVVAGVAFGRE